MKLRIENAYLKRTEEAAFRGRSSSEKQRESSTASREEFRLKEILAVVGFPNRHICIGKSVLTEWIRIKNWKNISLTCIRNIKDFGYRRMKAMLQREGICVNKKKVQRIMQKLGLQVTSYTRKSRRYNSYKGKVGRIAPNRINRRFHTTIPHQKITTDTTEFKYYEIDGKGKMTVKKLYLDPFLDMFNGEIMSYSISKTPSAESILSAQKKAIEVTSDCPYRRTFHSDRGWAYQMRTYSNRLKENKIFQSMSLKGNCYDNSVMENFFGILKQEMYLVEYLLQF